MALINVTRKTETIQAYQLTSHDDMHAALAYVVQSPNYSGTVNATRSIGGPVSWQLLLNDIVNSASSFGVIGDWVIIENNAVASICPQASFTTLYQT